MYPICNLFLSFEYKWHKYAMLQRDEFEQTLTSTEVKNGPPKKKFQEHLGRSRVKRPLRQEEDTVGLGVGRGIYSVACKCPLMDSCISEDYSFESWLAALSRCFPNLIHVLAVSSSTVKWFTKDCGLIRLICFINKVPKAAVWEILP